MPPKQSQVVSVSWSRNMTSSPALPKNAARGRVLFGDRIETNGAIVRGILYGADGIVDLEYEIE